MQLVIYIKNSNKLTLELKGGDKLISREGLTINRNLDNMLITAIDKMLSRNRISKLSLKNLKIQGKIRSEMVSDMILTTVKKGLGC